MNILQQNDSKLNKAAQKVTGTSYKDRYVEEECPECGYHKAYKDEGKTVTSYKCCRRSCKHNWFIHKKNNFKKENS